MDEKIFELKIEEMRDKAEHICGNKKIRNELKNVLDINFKTKDDDVKKFLNINGNILLYGEPGTGKTSICYELMLHEPKASYYHIDLSSLISSKLGATSKLVNQFFKEVVEKAKKYKVILLLEEIEAFLPSRESTKELEDMKRALTVFMHYLEKPIENLIVICTTNYKENLDKAIIRRFSFEYEIKNEEHEAFIEFLSDKRNPFYKNFINNDETNKIVDTLIKRNYTFSDLKNFMRKAYITNKDVNTSGLINVIKEERYE